MSALRTRSSSRKGEQVDQCRILRERGERERSVTGVGKLSP
jgi:hypothetical protein